MFKKLLVASAVLAASSVTFAGHYKGDYKGEVACPTCYTYSFMSGPYVGASLGVRNNYNGIPAVYKGIEGTLSLGYAGVLTPAFYLAGEIFAGDSWNVRNFPENGVSVRSTWTYGISLIPGMMLTDYVMAYVRLGAVRTRFSHEGENNTGWQVGVGGQTNLAPCWDLRGEYVYTGYRSDNDVGRPASDQFNIGVVYKFM